MFQFRDVTGEDFKVIASFPQNQEELFYMYPKGIHPLTADQLADAASERYSATVITLSNNVVGYSNLYDVTEGNECWIGNLIVSPNSRGIGAGTFLVQTMIRRAAEEHKVKQVKLICHNINTSALLLYYKLGFRPYDMKTMEDYNHRQLAGIKMSIEV